MLPNLELPGRVWAWALLCATAILPGLASAQLAAEIEGRIEPGSIKADGDFGASMTVMGITVVIDGAATIHSPSNPNLRDDTGAPTGLTTGTPLPNRGDNGFEGGTAIVIGTTGTDAAGNFVLNATDVFVEPAENVALGVINKVNANLACDGSIPGTGDFTVNGVALNFLTDETTSGRMPFAGAVDPNGFAIEDYCLIVDGGAAAVEGYYAGGVLNVFALEADATLPPNEDHVSIARAACRDNSRLEVRGATSSAEGFVDFDYDGNGSIDASTAITPDAVVIGQGEYRLRQDIAGACPQTVTVQLRGTAATATASF